MNKYILPFNQINESIGSGSVLLIKGRPQQDGRRLYVTTITGYAEIKPGLKMVFLSDTIYRVIHKGDYKFSGRKVSINREDGLTGVLNLKNPSRPSLVLNHNKTPYHWITLNHTDIGSALREIGTKLFDHEMILESESESTEADFNSLILSETLAYISGFDSKIKIVKSKTDYDGDFERYAMEESENDSFDIEWELEINLILDKEFLELAAKSGLDLSRFSAKNYMANMSSLDGLELIGIDPSDMMEGTSIKLTIFFNSTGWYSIVEDEGDYWTPPSHYLEHFSVDNTEINGATIEYLDIDDDVNITDKIEKQLMYFPTHPDNIVDRASVSKLESAKTIKSDIRKAKINSVITKGGSTLKHTDTLGPINIEGIPYEVKFFRRKGLTSGTKSDYEQVSFTINGDDSTTVRFGATGKHLSGEIDPKKYKEILGINDPIKYNSLIKQIRDILMAHLGGKHKTQYQNWDLPLLRV